MKIVIAPDSFKESLTALEAAKAIKKGFSEVFPYAEILTIPMADGGEGTVQSLTDTTDGTIVNIEVTGPIGEPVRAFFGLSGNGETAFIEMAAASGLHLVSKERRNPLLTTSRGTGELILAALDHGVQHIILGIGGSATNDGGAGMVQALGARLLDARGQEIGPGGEALKNLEKIDISNLDPRLAKVNVEVACDVDNPLVGPNGASHVYGPQKGATVEMIQKLDQSLAHYANVIEKELGKKVKEIKGAGAAGGLGAGLLAFLPVQLKRGIDIVIAYTNLETTIKDASLVITGEGKIDNQTVYGKTPIGVAKLAKKYNIPVIGIAGAIGSNSSAVYEHGIDALFSIVPSAMTLEEAIEGASDYLYKAARNIAKVMELSVQSLQKFDE